MNFQALHFSSEDEGDESSLSSYDSSEEEETSSLSSYDSSKEDFMLKGGMDYDNTTKLLISNDKKYGLTTNPQDILTEIDVDNIVLFNSFEYQFAKSYAKTELKDIYDKVKDTFEIIDGSRKQGMGYKHTLFRNEIKGNNTFHTDYKDHKINIIIKNDNCNLNDIIYKLAENNIHICKYHNENEYNISYYFIYYDGNTSSNFLIYFFLRQTYYLYNFLNENDNNRIPSLVNQHKIDMRDMLKEKTDETVERIEYKNIPEKINKHSKFMLPLHFICVNAEITTFNSPIDKGDTWEDVVTNYMDSFIDSLNLREFFKDHLKKCKNGEMYVQSSYDDSRFYKIKTTIERLIEKYNILNEYIIKTTTLPSHNNDQDSNLKTIEKKIINSSIIDKKSNKSNDYEKYIDKKDEKYYTIIKILNTRKENCTT